jgi:tRNA A-37 threonylcarbamoyl transferase component Bud32
LYFVNWEREIKKIRIKGKDLVIKKNKRFKSVRQFVLIFIFTIISILSANPCSPPPIGKKIIENENFQSRAKLYAIGIKTPKLIFISDTQIIEEYIAYGNLYEHFFINNDMKIARKAGVITGTLHNAGYTFIDNKSQNFLVIKDNDLVRIDIGLMYQNTSQFTKSMDIGTFLASILDLESIKYHEIEKEFLRGYIQTTNNVIPYLSVILRNVLALGFVANYKKMVKNMIKKYNN